MQRKIGFTPAFVGLAFMLGGAQRTFRADTKSRVVEIRKELLQLPYYGVFDFLAFYSGPDFGFPHGDARLDLTDLYAFPKPGTQASRS
jgi:hypothetical protein